MVLGRQPEFYLKADQACWECERKATRMAPSMRMHRLDLLAKVENVVGSVVRGAHPAEWNEDHISYSITSQISSKFNNIEVTGLQHPMRVTWDLRKLRGKPETAFGDLAVLVQIRHIDCESVHGIGFLEAKRRGAEKTTYEALSKTQLKRIVGKAPSARLLLYDWGQTVGFQDNSGLLIDHPYYRDHPLHWVPMTRYSHAVSLPISLAVASGAKDPRLHKFSIPFAEQLCLRYLHGFDLEHEESIEKLVEKFINKTGGPRILLLASVSFDGAQPAETTIALPNYIRADEAAQQTDED